MAYRQQRSADGTMNTTQHLPTGPKRVKLKHKAVMKTVQEAVAERIASAGPSVFDGVVDILADSVIKKRKDIVVQAVGTLDKLEKEHAKINRNDNVTFVDGQRHESMTEKRFNEIKKSKERMDRLSAAISKALETNATDDYTKLEKLSSGKPDDSAKEQGGGSGEE